MTRKHFETIAAELRRQDPRPYDPTNVEWSSGAYCEWSTIVLGMADVLHRFNSNFDRARFLAACGLAS
jgi:hypothetical protein